MALQFIVTAAYSQALENTFLSDIQNDTNARTVVTRSIAKALLQYRIYEEDITIHRFRNYERVVSSSTVGDNARRRRLANTTVEIIGVIVDFNVSFNPHIATRNYSATPAFAHTQITDTLVTAIQTGVLQQYVVSIASALSSSSFQSVVIATILPTFSQGYAKMIIHSAKPTSNPTTQPSGSPTGYPSSQPSRQPSRQPSSSPSGQPTSIPTSMPTLTWDTRWKIYLTGLFESKNRSASFYVGDESYRLTYYDLVVNQARYFGGCDAWEMLFAQQIKVITSSYTMKQLTIYSQTGHPGSDLLKASCSDKEAVLNIVDNAAFLQRQLQANATMVFSTSLNRSISCDGVEWKVFACPRWLNGSNVVTHTMSMCANCSNPCIDYTCSYESDARFTLSPCGTNVECYNNTGFFRMLHLEYDDIPQAGITSIVFSFVLSFPLLFVMFYYYDRYRGGKGERVKDVSALKAKHVMEPFLSLGSFGAGVFGDSVKLASQSFDFLPPLQGGWSTVDDDEHVQLQKDIAKANSLFRPLSKFVAVWKWSSWGSFWSTWSKLWRKHWVFQVAVGNRRQLRYAFALRLFSTVCWVMFITMSLLHHALPPNDTSCQVHVDQTSCEDRRSYLNDHKPVCRWITSDVSQLQFANAPEAWCRWYQRKLSGMEWIKLIILSLLCIGAVEAVLGSVVFDGILAVTDKPLNHLFGHPPPMEEVADHFTNREPQTLEEFNRRQEKLRHPSAASSTKDIAGSTRRSGPLRWFHRLIGRPLRSMKVSSAKVETDPTRGMFGVTPGGNNTRPRNGHQESKVNSSSSHKGNMAPSSSRLSYRSDADMGNFDDNNDNGTVDKPKRLSAVLPVRAVDLAQERRQRNQPLHLPPLTVDNMRQKYEQLVENTPVSKILFDQMIAELFQFREALPPEAQQLFDQEWSEIGLPISYLSPFFEAIHAHIDRDAKEFHYFAKRKQMLIREELERVRAQAHCLGQHLLVEHAAQTNEDIQLLLLVTLIRDVLGWHSLESHLFVRVMNERLTAGSMYPWVYLSARGKWAVSAVILLVSLFLFCWSLVRIRDFSWDRQWDWWILVIAVLGANLLVVQLWETFERQVIYRALFARQWSYVEDFLSINLGILKRSSTSSSDAAWIAAMPPRGSSAAETVRTDLVSQKVLSTRMGGAMSVPPPIDDRSYDNHDGYLMPPPGGGASSVMSGSLATNSVFPHDYTLPKYRRTVGMSSAMADIVMLQSLGRSPSGTSGDFADPAMAPRSASAAAAAMGTRGSSAASAVVYHPQSREDVVPIGTAPWSVHSSDERVGTMNSSKVWDASSWVFKGSQSKATEIQRIAAMIASMRQAMTDDEKQFNLAPYVFVASQVVGTMSPYLPLVRLVSQVSFRHPLVPVLAWDQCAFWYAWCNGFDDDQAVYHPQRFPHYAWYQHPWYYPWQPLPRGASLWWHIRFRVGYVCYLIYAAAVFVLFQCVWMVPARLRLILRWYTVRTPVVLRLFVKYLIVSGCLFGGSVMYTLVYHHNGDTSWVHSLEIPRQTEHDDGRRWWFVSVASFVVGALTCVMYASVLYPVSPPLSVLILLQSLVNGLVTCINFLRRVLVTLCCCCLGTKAFLSAETAQSRGMDGTAGGLSHLQNVLDGSDSDDSDAEEDGGEGGDVGGDGGLLDGEVLDHMQSMEEGNSRDAADEHRRRRRSESHALAHSRAKSVHFHGEQHPSFTLEGLHDDDGFDGGSLAADDDDDDFADGLFLDDLANLRDSYDNESDDGKRSDSYPLGTSLASLTAAAATAAATGAESADDRSVASNASHIRKALSGLALHSPIRTRPPTVQVTAAAAAAVTETASSPLSDEPEPNSAEGLKSLVSNKPLRTPASPLKLARPGGLAPKPNTADGPSDATPHHHQHHQHQRPLVRTSPLRSVADHSQAEDDEHGDYSSSEASSDED